MYKILLLSFCLFFTVVTVNAQEKLTNKKDSTNLNTQRTDSVKPYVNQGKIAGRRAAIRSAMLPGLGQIRNGFNLYRGLKVAGIYTGATLLTLSYIDNSKQYDIFIKELEYRAANNDKPSNPIYANSPTDRLISAKDIYRRNKQVILFSYGGLYLLNIVEAYIDARLANFDVGDVARIKISPDLLLNSNQMYGFNSIAPGMKIAISF